MLSPTSIPKAAPERTENPPYDICNEKYALMLHRTYLDAIESDEEFLALTRKIEAQLDAIKTDRLYKTNKIYRYFGANNSKLQHNRNLGVIIGDFNGKNILMYIEQVDNYVLFKDVEEYMMYVGNAGSDIDCNYRDYVKYQIILTDMAHKLTLMYRDDGNKETLARIQRT